MNSSTWGVSLKVKINKLRIITRKKITVIVKKIIAGTLSRPAFLWFARLRKCCSALSSS